VLSFSSELQEKVIGFVGAELGVFWLIEAELAACTDFGF
jgi:hypothetical protein